MLAEKMEKCSMRSFVDSFVSRCSASRFFISAKLCTIEEERSSSRRSSSSIGLSFSALASAS